MAAEDVVKAVYEDGTISYYDASEHAHATHYDGAKAVSIEPAPGEAERVEQPHKAAAAAEPAADAED